MASRLPVALHVPLNSRQVSGWGTACARVGDGNHDPVASNKITGTHRANDWSRVTVPLLNGRASVAGNVTDDKAKLRIGQIQNLPKVDIIYAYASMGRDLIDAAVAAGAKGLVIAGVGNGNFTKEAFEGLRDARKKGVVIVRSTRLASGFTTRNAEVDDDTEGFVASEEFKPSKARVILKACASHHVVSNRNSEVLRPLVSHESHPGIEFCAESSATRLDQGDPFVPQPARLDTPLDAAAHRNRSLLCWYLYWCPAVGEEHRQGAP
jgi:hypothetical protein